MRSAIDIHLSLLPLVMANITGGSNTPFGMPASFLATTEGPVIAQQGRNFCCIGLNLKTCKHEPLSLDKTLYSQEGGYITLAWKNIRFDGGFGGHQISTDLFRFVRHELEVIQEKWLFLKFVLPVDDNGNYINGCHVLDVSDPELEIAFARLFARVDEFLRFRRVNYTRHSSPADARYYLSYSKLTGDWSANAVAVPPQPLTVIPQQLLDMTDLGPSNKRHRTEYDCA